MSFRLVGQFDDQAVRLIVPLGHSVLGAAPECELRLSAPTVSRQHARLSNTDGQLLIEDLGSSNGTFVKNQRVSAPTAVCTGSEIRLGELRLRVESIASGDEAIGMAVNTRVRRETAVADRMTLAPIAGGQLAFDVLPELLNRLAKGLSLTAAARAIGQALWSALPLVHLRLSEPHGSAVIFDAGEASPDDDQSRVIGRLEISHAWSEQCDPGRSAEMLNLVEALLALASDAPTRLDGEDESSAGWPDPRPLDPEVTGIYLRAARAAKSDLSILIAGESGTGKELLAKFIHRHSTVSTQAFVALNCAALSSDLLEAELFGIEKGVATGVEARAGCFERAHGGTLFLDEIGDMPPATQAKILRVLQEGEVMRVGGTRAIPARPRILSATNREVGSMVGAGQFRLDLLHRIAGWEVTLPPLRHRPADIGNLAMYFLTRYTEQRGIRVRGISQRALDCLRHYQWPGNVRELQQEMQRVAVFFGPDDLLSSNDLRREIRGRNGLVVNHSLEAQMARAERTIIKSALAQSDGNVSRAAQSLGISRSTLYRRLEQLGLDPS